MTNSLDPDQARRIVGPDLGPNCLPRLSADDTGRQRVNTSSGIFSEKKVRVKGLPLISFYLQISWENNKPLVITEDNNYQLPACNSTPYLPHDNSLVI